MIYFERAKCVWDSITWQGQETLYSANIYRYLIYAIFIELHGYPTKGFFEKQYDTLFKSLAYSRKYERFDEKGRRRVPSTGRR